MSQSLTLSEVREMLIIDKEDLDTELIRQAQFVADVGMIAAGMRSRRELAKERAAQVNARVWEAEEDFLKKKGDGRVTKVMVDARVDQNKDFIAARKEYKELSRLADEWEAMFEAVKARGFMLRDLVQLAVVRYYDDGSASVRPAGIARPTYLPRKTKVEEPDPDDDDDDDEDEETPKPQQRKRPVS